MFNNFLKHLKPVHTNEFGQKFTRNDEFSSEQE